MENYKLSGKYLEVLKYINKCDKEGTSPSLSDLPVALKCRPDYIVTIVTELLEENLIKISNDNKFFSTPKSITIIKNMHKSLIEKIIFNVIIPIIVSIVTASITAYISIKFHIN